MSCLHKLKSLLLIININILFIINLYGQDKYSLNGYISNMQSVMFDSIDKDWIADNLIHNRLNFNWYPTNNFSATLQIRNRFIYGETQKYTPGYAKQLEGDQGIIDLSWNIFNEHSFLLNSNIDRLWIKYTNNNFEATIGRQRINWGQTYIWNPNDIFNNYNFFDFDYPEKPGSDAIRLLYYTGMASSIELVGKIDSTEKVTSALLVRLNKWNYDFQILGGMLSEQDYIAGAGWSGNLANFGFKGEMSYFHPKENFNDTTGLYYVSLSLDYFFANSLYLQTEALYKWEESSTSINGFMEFYSGPMNVKNLTFLKFSYFTQASYTISPLWNTTLSFMYFPEIDNSNIKGFFIGPSLSYSISDNIEIATFIQLFSGEFPDPAGNTSKQNFTLAFIRLKANF